MTAQCDFDGVPTNNCTFERAKIATRGDGYTRHRRNYIFSRCLRELKRKESTHMNENKLTIELLPEDLNALLKACDATEINMTAAQFASNIIHNHFAGDPATDIMLSDTVLNATVEIEAAQNILSMLIGKFWTQYDGDVKLGVGEIAINWHRAEHILSHISGVLMTQCEKLNDALTASTKERAARND